MGENCGDGVLREGSSSMGERDFVDKDKLILRGLQFHGFHGVKPEEKKLGQKFVIDVDAWMDLSNAGKSDDISDTVSYTAIYRILKEVVEGPSQNLLESVAHLIANTTLLQFPQISAVRVKVGKPHVAVRGTIDYLGVEILRYKKASSVDEEALPNHGCVDDDAIGPYRKVCIYLSIYYIIEHVF
ncbi:dihydroneopterin aldolase 2-like isoform X2 [Musa acuminata AAA Group]|uniref:dihydroneopterin aldolase 2-like isoform X2 n=1 Tax=Musa acuminata AAA Group TaxID=214697 RepID=UPI0031D4551E